MGTYVTVQGDCWDNIAKTVYGSETAMDALLRANPEQLGVAVFGAGVVLQVPDLPAAAQPSAGLPPWRQEGGSR